MKLEMTGQMRLEQKLKMAPHMIQSMEILQLPMLALQERIEQELNTNPVLETDVPEDTEQAEPSQETESQSRDLSYSAVPADKAVENFERIDSFDDDYKNYVDQADQFTPTIRRDEPDRKLEALKNTEAPQKSLHEFLTEQWHLIEAGEKIKKAGEVIIDYIDDRGYLSVRLEQLHNKDRKDYSFEDLQTALSLIQQLEPVGVGARDLAECLLIQIRQSDENMEFEKKLISEYMNELLENHLPEIAKKMDCSMERINEAIGRISKFDTSPGLQVGKPRNHVISVDVIVEPVDNETGYAVRLANSPIPPLRISDYYSKMANDKNTNAETRKFLQNNIRSAQWIIDAVQQRKNTLLKVSESIVRRQAKFFEKGELYLKPLPMSVVADDVGVHLATVSRAVAGKYLQCHWGIIPLRKFFSGGTENENGQAMSWEAIRVKLKQIIDEEDKTRPLSDDKIREKLEEYGIKDLARRTVAKYRKLLDIPSARMRKKY
ncbi:MAG: RNA polymerase factor sigma-54 [Sedimentisphaerales bacterium]|nr:RNA polymerase factor sigma-54 [Sedimentisphaerales bacterium]